MDKLLFSGPTLEPVERENPDKTCLPSQQATFKRQLQAMIRGANLAALGSGAGSTAASVGDVTPAADPAGSPDDMDGNRSMSDSASVAGSRRGPGGGGATSIPVLHEANIALWRAKEELRQAVDVMALMSGVPSNVPEGDKLYQPIQCVSVPKAPKSRLQLNAARKAKEYTNIANSLDAASKRLREVVASDQAFLMRLAEVRCVVRVSAIARAAPAIGAPREAPVMALSDATALPTTHDGVIVVPPSIPADEMPFAEIFPERGGELSLRHAALLDPMTLQFSVHNVKHDDAQYVHTVMLPTHADASASANDRIAHTCAVLQHTVACRRIINKLMQEVNTLQASATGAHRAGGSAGSDVSSAFDPRDAFDVEDGLAWWNNIDGDVSNDVPTSNAGGTTALRPQPVPSAVAVAFAAKAASVLPGATGVAFQVDAFTKVEIRLVSVTPSQADAGDESMALASTQNTAAHLCTRLMHHLKLDSDRWLRACVLEHHKSLDGVASSAPPSPTAADAAATTAAAAAPSLGYTGRLVSLARHLAACDLLNASIEHVNNTSSAVKLAVTAVHSGSKHPIVQVTTLTASFPATDADSEKVVSAAVAAPSTTTLNALVKGCTVQIKTFDGVMSAGTPELLASYLIRAAYDARAWQAASGPA